MNRKSREYRLSKERSKEYWADKFFNSIKPIRNKIPFGFKIENNKIIPLYELTD